MTSRIVKTLGTCVLVIGLGVAGVACGGDDDDGAAITTESVTASTEPATTGPVTSTTELTTTGPVTSTTEPAAAIRIDFVCGNGDTGTVDFDSDDEDEIDDTVNGTDVCENLGGLVEISFTARCPSGDRDVTVGAVDGALPPFETIDYCENDR